MRRFEKVFNSRMLIADGAMGTLLQQKLPAGFIPDEINLSSPRTVAAIHHEYARSGADILTSNTFGASPLKLRQSGLEKKFRQINFEALRLVREVADREGCWVAGDIGPSGRLIEPLGDLGFTNAAASFGAQARALQRGGADFILLETIGDIQEFRAALVGILASVTIPVLASMSFSTNGVSLSGSDGRVFAVTSDFIGLLAVGANCGSSLEDTRLAMELIARHSPKPIFCQPNAGLPRLAKKGNGKTVFSVTPSQFADFMSDMVGLGAALIGSCCGSTPEFTRELAKRYKNYPIRHRAACGAGGGAGDLPLRLRFATRTRVSEPQPGRIFLVGERINPSNRPKLRRELEQGCLTTARFDAREQARAGADALDLNLNTSGALADTIVAAVCQGVQHAADLPLFIDTTDPRRVEVFARNFAGKGVINSISGETKSLRRLLPLARKYNLALIASLLDENGIPATVAGRLRIARRIMAAAVRLQIPPRDLIFDPLVLSAAAAGDKVAVTLDTIAALKSEFPDNRVVIGLSNISFGLPNRPLLNAVFLGLAASRGLDMVIANPLDETMRQQLLAVNLLADATPASLSAFIAAQSPPGAKTEDRVHQGSSSLNENIIEGDIDSARQNLDRLLKAERPLKLIEGHVIPAMNEVGRRYQNGEFFLPHLIAAAEVVKAILPAIRQRLGTAAVGERPARVTLATVKGDIHDIGKNIVASILESFNFSVHDLGRDVAPEKIVTAAVREQSDVIGLSSLMTTTLPAMFHTIELIKTSRELQRVRVFIGGAVVSAEIARQHGVDYARDGLEMARRIQNNHEA